MVNGLWVPAAVMVGKVDDPPQGVCNGLVEKAMDGWLVNKVVDA